MKLIAGTSDLNAKHRKGLTQQPRQWWVGFVHSPAPLLTGLVLSAGSDKHTQGRDLSHSEQAS